MELRVKFGERVRQARLEAGLNQAELASKVGVATRTVQYWESSENGTAPRSAAMRQLAKVTGKPIAWFYEVAA